MAPSVAACAESWYTVASSAIATAQIVMLAYIAAMAHRGGQAHRRQEDRSKEA